uniref:Lipoprotein n=1 Tax=Desulfovibrio sp. U5L TaxID=596152 RepID=I2PYC7_9BACT
MATRMRSVLAVLAACVWFAALSGLGHCAGTGAAAFDPAAERIGGLRLGLPAGEVAAVACPPQKGRETYEGATGEYVETWTMPACGVTLKMSGPKKGGPKVVAGVTVTAPSGLGTRRGIHIGSAEAAVTAAYGRYRDREGASRPGRTFVAGSIYDGLIFDFKDGKVVRIFLGAAAE